MDNKGQVNTLHAYTHTAKMNLAIIFLVCSFLINTSLATDHQSAENKEQNPCLNQISCHECIQTQKCSWCMQPDYGNRPRCFQSFSPSTCKEEFVWNPDSTLSTLIDKNLTLTGRDISQESSVSKSGSSYRYEAQSEEIVQIKPQRVSLQLHINQSVPVQVSYSQASDYPVDLYFLMDLSKSMEDDKEKLSELGIQLSQDMSKITSNFRLGFGSFVDKVLMPYTSTLPKNLESPCLGCGAPYGFRHVLSLTKDVQKFTDEVRKAAVSRNLDAPEGGFDGIMQAIACRQEVGWREQARRLLVFSTDAGFHSAGDGKLGGVITPNDGECHLDSSNYYSHSSVQDYPSISQINQKVKQNAINIIFAVTQSQYSVYQKLSATIEGSSVAVLSKDSSNVVELVKEEYGKISSSVEMKDNATSEVKIDYFSSCLNGIRTKTSKCSGLKVGDKVTFEAEITVLRCPKDPRDWNQVIQIYPIGINESLIIDLEMQCTCPCEHPGSKGYEANSEKCNFGGNFMCGKCDCDEQHFGKHCEFSVLDILLNSSNASMCRAEDSTVDCSARGTCLYGFCDCARRTNPEEVISGKFCECDNFSCERNNMQLCSGPDQGTCECGKCVCKPGWTGTNCGYPKFPLPLAYQSDRMQ